MYSVQCTLYSILTWDEKYEFEFIFKSASKKNRKAAKKKNVSENTQSKAKSSVPAGFFLAATLY